MTRNWAESMAAGIATEAGRAIASLLLARPTETGLTANAVRLTMQSELPPGFTVLGVHSNPLSSEVGAGEAVVVSVI